MKTSIFVEKCVINALKKIVFKPKNYFKWYFMLKSDKAGLRHQAPERRPSSTSTAVNQGLWTF